MLRPAQPLNPPAREYGFSSSSCAAILSIVATITPNFFPIRIIAPAKGLVHPVYPNAQKSLCKDVFASAGKDLPFSTESPGDILRKLHPYSPRDRHHFLDHRWHLCLQSGVIKNLAQRFPTRRRDQSERINKNKLLPISTCTASLNSDFIPASIVATRLQTGTGSREIGNSKHRASNCTSLSVSLCREAIGA